MNANKPVACIQDLNEVKRKQLVYGQGMDWKDPLYIHPVKTLFIDAENRDELIGQEFETYLEKLSQDFKDGFREGVLYCEDVAKQPTLYGQDAHPANHVTDSDYADAILQRDNYHAIADNLAEAIGAYFGIDIGEHSSANNPWAVALEHIESPHPAKTLTDEEIYKIYCEVEDTKCPSDDFEYMMFARAILRKEQEK